MKFSKFLLAITLSFGAILTPIKKAEAGLLIMNPTVIILAGAGFLGWTLPAIDEDTHGGLYERIFTPVSMTLGTIILLDKDLDKLEETLIKFNPSIPPYIISEASRLLLAKAGQTEFNDEGFKSISLSEDEFVDLERVMDHDIDDKVIAQFKLMLTSNQAFN
jgi:hypothetical protein